MAEGKSIKRKGSNGEITRALDHVVVRNAKIEDYSLCLPLLTLLYHGDIGTDFRHTFESYAARKDSVVLLAESCGRVVGILIGSYHIDIDWEGRTAKIDAVVVDEASRRIGIGKRLVRDFACLAQKRNCKAVKSRVNVRNEDAQKFHESLGFARTHTYEYVLNCQES